MAENNSGGSFGENLMSSSIYYKNENAENQLSEIMLSGLSQNELQKSLTDLNEKNELKIAYKKGENMTNKEVQESFIDGKIKATEKQYESNLTEAMLSKFKSNEKKQEDDLYLKIEDFSENPIAEMFIYSQVDVKNFIPIFEEDLGKLDINDLKRENIYKGKGVEVMVEETYGYDKYLKDQMIEEICYLKRIMSCWRRVAGDGNCFYRSVIFSWLEYLIFNKKITVLKTIMANLYSKFDPKYPKNKELPKDLMKQFITEEKYLALTIIEIIIRQLDNNQIKEAYLTLIKAFNVTRVFDRVMIFYLRYLLFEYISENQTKLFRQDFPIFLGNLLPQQYEKEDGTFLYKEYFINDLLKFYTCAEKIAVYLIPYILKVNLNIVFYYFGNECVIENKFFSCYLPGKDKIKDTINVLYRKAHYDICYTKEYYNDFQPLLDIYCDPKMSFGKDYYIVEPNIINQKEKTLNESYPFNPQESIVFNKVLFEKKNKEKQKEKEKEIIIENKNISNHINIQQDKIDFILSNGIMRSHSPDKCFVCEKEIVGNEKNEEILPCKCTISFCSDICKKKYYKCLEIFFNEMEFGINLKCGRCQKNIWKTIFSENINFEDENVRNALKNKIEYFLGHYCMYCLNSISQEIESKTIKCKCISLFKLFNRKSFNHIVCKECYNIWTGNCKICDLYHPRYSK